MSFLSNLLDSIGTWISHFWSEDLAPAIEIFLKPMATDEGKLALTLAVSFAQEIAGGKSFSDAGKDFIDAAASQGLTVAENDLLNMLRVQVNAINQTPAAAVPGA